MKRSRDPEDPSTRAAEALAPEAGLVALLDPMSFGQALIKAATGIARHPFGALLAEARFAAGIAGAQYAALVRALGVAAPGPAPIDDQDRRFADPAWQDNAAYFLLLEAYLLWRALAGDLIEAADLPELDRVKAEFAVGAIVDALAPTNFLATNPQALKKAFDTSGRSVIKGVTNFAYDLLNNGGWPRQVDTSKFVVGKNLAATPGKVVYRNDLMEVIQYAPETNTVFEVPILMSPPWINKYYILDLAPGRSFVEWAVGRGHTVFAMSYRNPDESMRDVSLDDYLIKGPRTSLDVVTDITGSAQVNLVGLCLGGTLTAMLLAHLAALDDDRVHSATLLNTLIDFSDPGPVRCFVEPDSVERISRKMARRGFLDAKEMDRTFRLLRANDLIWNYVASNWLMGEDPPAFDLLAWGADGTRMPAAMHSLYLRSCYLENQLAKGDFELAGTTLRLDAVAADVYLLACMTDHIVPWRSAYASTRLFKSDLRFVLGSSGHIAGLVNPPRPEARYWTNSVLPKDADAWLAGAREHHGSWWEDWAGWIEPRAGSRIQPPPMGSEAFPPLSPAPGTYVFQK